VFNVGTNQEVSMRQLADLVVKKTGSKSDVQLIPYSEAYPAGFEDMQKRVPDISRIGGLIGFRPSRTLDDILADVMEDQSARLQKEKKVNGQHSA
jgi:UDP-glucose 4-epimerase